MNEETLQQIEDEKLDETLEDFREEIYRALLSCPLRDVKQVDVIFYMSASGVIPEFEIRRVFANSDVKSQSLYRNVYKIISFDVEHLKEMRRKTNNE